MLPGFPGGIPLVGLWRRVHEFSGNVTTAYHGIWADTADLFSGCALRQFKDYDHSCRNYSLKFFKCRHQYDQTFKYGYHGESDVFSDRFPLRAYPKQADPAVPLYCYCILCFLVSRTAVKYARAWG